MCVCGANYKYFILFMFYAGMMFVAMGFAVTVLTQSFTNEFLRREQSNKATPIVLGCVVWGIITFCFGCIFLCEGINPKGSNDPIYT